MSGELWVDYRRTWETFSRKLHEMQELTEAGQNRAASVALVAVEAARLEHDAARDRLVKYLVTRKMAATTTADHRIRKTARLIWEFSGKPQNTAERDWHRAEELVRAASA
jgi:hypothetical protein